MKLAFLCKKAYFRLVSVQEEYYDKILSLSSDYLAQLKIIDKNMKKKTQDCKLKPLGPLTTTTFGQTRPQAYGK